MYNLTYIKQQKKRLTMQSINNTITLQLENFYYQRIENLATESLGRNGKIGVKVLIKEKDKKIGLEENFKIKYYTKMEFINERMKEHIQWCSNNSEYILENIIPKIKESEKLDSLTGILMTRIEEKREEIRMHYPDITFEFDTQDVITHRSNLNFGDEKTKNRNINYWKKIDKLYVEIFGRNPNDVANEEMIDNFWIQSCDKIPSNTIHLFLFSESNFIEIIKNPKDIKYNIELKTVQDMCLSWSKKIYNKVMNNFDGVQKEIKYFNNFNWVLNNYKIMLNFVLEIKQGKLILIQTDCLQSVITTINKCTESHKMIDVIGSNLQSHEYDIVTCPINKSQVFVKNKHNNFTLESNEITKETILNLEKFNKFSKKIVLKLYDILGHTSTLIFLLNRLKEYYELKLKKDKSQLKTTKVEKIDKNVDELLHFIDGKQPKNFKNKKDKQKLSNKLEKIKVIDNVSEETNKIKEIQIQEIEQDNTISNKLVETNTIEILSNKEKTLFFSEKVSNQIVGKLQKIISDENPIACKQALVHFHRLMQINSLERSDLNSKEHFHLLIEALHSTTYFMETILNHLNFKANSNKSDFFHTHNILHKFDTWFKKVKNLTLKNPNAFHDLLEQWIVMSFWINYTHNEKREWDNFIETSYCKRKMPEWINLLARASNEYLDSKSSNETFQKIIEKLKNDLPLLLNFVDEVLPEIENEDVFLPEGIKCKSFVEINIKELSGLDKKCKKLFDKFGKNYTDFFKDHINQIRRDANLLMDFGKRWSGPLYTNDLSSLFNTILFWQNRVLETTLLLTNKVNGDQLFKTEGRLHDLKKICNEIEWHKKPNESFWKIIESYEGLHQKCRYMDPDANSNEEVTEMIVKAQLLNEYPELENGSEIKTDKKYQKGKFDSSIITEFVKKRFSEFEEAIKIVFSELEESVKNKKIAH